MSDPHRWDRWDRTIPRPLTGRRLTLLLGYRIVGIVVATMLAIGTLVAALTAPSRSTWTLFGLVAVFWVFAVPAYVFVSIWLVRARRRERVAAQQTAHGEHDE